MAKLRTYTLLALFQMLIFLSSCQRNDTKNTSMTGLADILTSDSLSVIYLLDGNCALCIGELIDLKKRFDNLHLDNTFYVKCENINVPILEYYLQKYDVNCTILPQNNAYPYGENERTNILIYNKYSRNITNRFYFN